MPRWRVLLPVALVLTVSAPALRGLPVVGAWLPDPWLLLLLLAVPEPPPRLRRPLLLVLLFGVLRATVTALPVEACWAALGVALPLRHFLAKRLVLARLPGAWLVGTAACLAATAVDALNGLLLGLDPPLLDFALRSLATGLVWAWVVRAPGRRLRPGRPREALA